MDSNYVTYHNYIVEKPDSCPYCHITQIVSLESLITQNSRYDDILISLWRCSNSSCNRTIITENSYFHQTGKHNFSRFVENRPISPDFPDAVSNLKNGLDISQPTKFLETYNQSLVAEQMGLNEIAGMGFRKAIEYLVKDLAVSKNPAEIMQIKAKTLTAVVKDYFTGDLKDILERAVWLGNDQTHYFKIFEQFDLVMLKNLIEFVLADLDREYKREHYLAAITAHNKGNEN